MPLFSGLHQYSAKAQGRGPLSIAAGLAILTAVMLWPGAPAVTAMALVTLGATSMMVARFRHAPSILAIMLVHGALYGGLYALFVSATLDAAARSGAGLGAVVIIDLALSTGPLAVALDLLWSALGTGSAQ